MFKSSRYHPTPPPTTAGAGKQRPTSQSPFSQTQANATDSPSAATSSSSPELPEGVCFIRQTPTSIYRSVTNKSATVTKQRRDQSPGKSLRFAEPLVSSTKNGALNSGRDSRAKSSERIDRLCRHSSRDRQQLNRPVIKPSKDTPDSGTGRYCGQRSTVVKSPATDGSRQTSPIFASASVFGGDSNHAIGSKGRSAKTESRDSTPDSMDRHSPTEPKTVYKTAINVPNKTTHKSTTQCDGTSGHVHRKTLTIPLQSLTNRKGDPNRLSVNVNVAVGLQCDDDKLATKKVSEPPYTPMMSQPVTSDDSASETGSVLRQDTSDELDYNVGQSVSGSSIQVAVRMRPFLKCDQSDECVVDMSGNTVRIVNADNEKHNRLEFGFDCVLNSSDRDLFDFADQSKVYCEMGAPLLERALEGYNVCMFAYGQTGSGKSFTMMGAEPNMGVIPRFVRELFKRFQSLNDIVFTVEVSYCEIYNEKIYDLLSDDKVITKKTLRIREHPQSGPYVEHLSQHLVHSYPDVMDLLVKGTRRRATASTAVNDMSSRSHAILTIELSQLRNSPDMGLDVSCCCVSRINLIDLAGSERVGIAGTSGDRLKEGSLINKSLMNLGKVIQKLADISVQKHKVAHIPYRDSILTYLLKDSLGGNSRTSMIATISPSKSHLEETLSTLRYASTARRIVNFVHINEDPKNRKIRELLEEIEFLKRQQLMADIACDKQNPSDDSLESNEYNGGYQTEPKTTETMSIGTNTSFVERRVSTKGTDTSFAHQKCSIATNTSFIKSPKTCTTGTDAVQPPAPPKPITKSTATEMSWSEKHSKTTFVDMPTREDIWKGNRLEEQQKKLLEEMRVYRERILGKTNGSDGGVGGGGSGGTGWTTLTGHSSRGLKSTYSDYKSAQSGEESEYFDCPEVIKAEPVYEGYEVSLQTAKKYPKGVDEVDRNAVKEVTKAVIEAVVGDDDWAEETDPVIVEANTGGEDNKASNDGEWGDDNAVETNDWDDGAKDTAAATDEWPDDSKTSNKSDKKSQKKDKKSKKKDKKSDKKDKSGANDANEWGDGGNDWTNDDKDDKTADEPKDDYNEEQNDDNWCDENTTVINNNDKNEDKDDCNWGTDDKGTDGNDWGTDKTTTGDDWATGADKQETNEWGTETDDKDKADDDQWPADDNNWDNGTDDKADAGDDKTKTGDDEWPADNNDWGTTGADTNTEAAADNGDDNWD